jgi:drug/metabolite transporter (DMT)-like permease
LPVTWRVMLVAVVAVALGAAFNDERVHVAALFGTALVLAGAYLTSGPSD